MSIKEKLEKLFIGELDELTSEDFLGQGPSFTATLPRVVACTSYVEEGDEAWLVDFIRRDERWIVTAYQPHPGRRSDEARVKLS